MALVLHLCNRLGVVLVRQHFAIISQYVIIQLLLTFVANHNNLLLLIYCA